MLATEFYKNFELSLIVSHYERGGELQLQTADEIQDRIKQKIKKFKEKGLL